MPVLFQRFAAFPEAFFEKNHWRVTHAGENCQANSSGALMRYNCGYDF
jgi:hypothetical protein